MRERISRVFLLLDGQFFLAGVYPTVKSLWDPAKAGETVMLSIYFPLGVFLLLAFRNPSDHRCLIAFAGWANVAHGLVMSLMAVRMIDGRRDLRVATLLCLFVGVALIVSLPRRPSVSAAAVAPGASMHAHAG